MSVIYTVLMKHISVCRIRYAVLGYNIQVLPKYEVNIESCQLSGKTTSRGLTTWCSHHMKVITVLVYRNYSKMFITWIFVCRRQQNNFRYRKYNYGTKLKQNGFWTHFRLSVVVSPSALYFLYVWVVYRVVSLVSIFSEKHFNFLITFI